jgi:transcriptional regulator with XRE-family HTH domain
MARDDYSENKAEITAQIQRISRRLREEREKARISQMDLSFKAGLSQNQVNYIETGKRSPNLHTILSICNALQISPSALFEEYGIEWRERRKAHEAQAAREARKTIIRLVSQFM